MAIQPETSSSDKSLSSPSNISLISCWLCVMGKVSKWFGFPELEASAVDTGSSPGRRVHSNSRVDSSKERVGMTLKSGVDNS